ncbi:hypothetical protein GBAR_LOCUS14761 [Geodia barretti]|uniref:Uncharacterized protein n=1 Tax=Geodia barretti TaxID=519541 RepID=A0AA35WT06_GEOBA|nr:hypothetical protein GBAR_LOCUS14761 [Geodia barretti]
MANNSRWRSPHSRFQRLSSLLLLPTRMTRQVYIQCHGNFMKNTDCWAKFSDKNLFLVLQVTQMKIKNNPFAKAFLGGNASERAHSGSYIQPLQMVARLHSTLLPPLPHPSPPPYSAPFPGPPPLQSFAPQHQGANYSLSPHIQQQMTPPVIPSDQFVYDYNGPIEVYDEVPTVMSCYQPQTNYLYDYGTTTDYSPDYLAKPLLVFSHDDDPGHTPLPTTPSTASSTSQSPPALEDQQCFYQPFHQSI